jgi:hypothetical protein
MLPSQVLYLTLLTLLALLRVSVDIVGDCASPRPDTTPLEGHLHCCSCLYPVVYACHPQWTITTCTAPVQHLYCCASVVLKVEGQRNTTSDNIPSAPVLMCLCSAQVQAVRKQLGGFRSVPVSPAGAEVRKTMDELKRPPMSPQLEVRPDLTCCEHRYSRHYTSPSLEVTISSTMSHGPLTLPLSCAPAVCSSLQAFRRALDDPFRDYKPPPIPVLGGGSAGASRAMSRSASLAH